jgi:hypothetical protein
MTYSLSINNCSFFHYSIHGALSKYPFQLPQCHSTSLNTLPHKILLYFVQEVPGLIIILITAVTFDSIFSVFLSTSRKRLKIAITSFHILLNSQSYIQHCKTQTVIKVFGWIWGSHKSMVFLVILFNTPTERNHVTVTDQKVAHHYWSVLK